MTKITAGDSRSNKALNTHVENAMEPFENASNVQQQNRKCLWAENCVNQVVFRWKKLKFIRYVTSCKCFCTEHSFSSPPITDQPLEIVVWTITKKNRWSHVELWWHFEHYVLCGRNNSVDNFFFFLISFHVPTHSLDCLVRGSFFSSIFIHVAYPFILPFCLKHPIDIRSLFSCAVTIFRRISFATKQSKN